MKLLDLTNVRFGLLVALNVNGRKRNYKTWLCLCDCGNSHTVSSFHLTGGYTKSCGCATSKWLSESSSTHGMSNTVEYEAWKMMKRRCLNPNDKFYFNYGGRGIKICDRWLASFENFLLDIGKKPSDSYSLDRINSDGNYEPNNCRWATRKQQASNRKSNRWIEYNGERLILQDWATKTGIPVANLHFYLKRHTMSEAIIHYSNKKSG